MAADNNASSSSTSKKNGLPPVVSHRGESYLAPENTMAAFNLAWQLDDDGVENDIQLTKDGRVIVCHDPDTFRTTGGVKGKPESGKKLVIKDSTADELRKLDVGTWKDKKYAGEKLPFLEECLASQPAGKVFFVEIKSGTDVVPAGTEIIKKSGKKAEEIVLISFHADALGQSKKLLPDHQHYLLAGSAREKGGKGRVGWQYKVNNKNVWVESAEELIAEAKKQNANGLNLQNNEPLDAATTAKAALEGPAGEAALAKVPRKPAMDKAFIDKVHAAGLKCLVWTEDDAAAAQRWVDLGIDGITTNRANWLKKQLKPAK